MKMIGNIGDRIKEQRNQKCLSQEELAKKLKVSSDEVLHWESGQTMPDISNIVGMAEMFDVTTDYILIGDRIKNKNAISHEKYRILCVVGIITSVSILLCTPLCASLYQSIQFAVFHTCYTNFMDYIWEWPLIGIPMSGLILLICCRYCLKKQKSIKVRGGVRIETIFNELEMDFS